MSEPEIRNGGNGEISAPARRAEESEPHIGIVERRGVDRLFLDYYGLNEQPFGVTPDLRFLYLGKKHQQALDVLNYGTELNRGFLTLIAKPGMGKTSLLFRYLEGLRDKARTVFLFQTDGDSTQLMRYLLADLGIDGKGMDLPEMRASLSQVLMDEMEAGRRFVLVVDEAQNLDEKVLESIRLLSNFETPWMKLMQIVLAGQPQLADRLAAPSMAQLRQRVSFGVRLEPFTREEVDLYIDHRLWVAGYKGSPIFSVGARARIAERSDGIPRIINNLCFCAMSYAWAMKRKAVDREMMSDVFADIDPELPNETEEPTPNPPEDSNLSVSQTPYPVGVTTSASPSRRWLPKTVVTGLLLCTLGWLGTQLNVDKWMGSTFHALSDVVTNFGAQQSEPVSPNPASTTGPNISGTRPKSGRFAENKDVKARPPADVDSSSSGGGRN